MDRKDILQMAQHEGKGRDEMEKKVKLSSMRHAEILILIPLALFAFIRLIKQEPVNDFWCICFGLSGFPVIYTMIKEHRFIPHFLEIIAVFMTVISFVVFLRGYGFPY